MRKPIVWVFILTLVLTACGVKQADDQRDASAAQAVEVETALETVDSGDWPSVEAYAVDMIDTLDGVEVISSTMADAAGDASEGNITFSDYAILADTAITTLDTHIDYFRGTTAPAVFAEVHGYILQGMDEMRAGLVYSRDGATFWDVDLMSQGVEALNDANASFENAVAAVPTDVVS